MGYKGRLLFDLNEPPTDDDGENDAVFCFQPQRAIPFSSTATSDLFSVSTVPHGIVTKHAFSHASSLSGFQPFVGYQIVKGSNHSVEERNSWNAPHNFSPLPEPSNGQDVNAVLNLQSGSAEAQAEKEEGEWWSHTEGALGTGRNFLTHEESSIVSCKHMQEKGIPEITRSNDLVGEGNMSLNFHDAKNENISSSVGLDYETNNKRSDVPMDAQEGSALETKQREIRRVEANNALRYANNIGKRPKVDQQKEAMLGKKRSRQTMFLNMEDVKQAGVLKTSSPRRHIPAPTIIRAKEGRATMPSSEQGDKQFQSINRDAKQSDVSSDGGDSLIKSNDLKNEANGENNSMPLGCSRSSNSSTDLISEGQVAPVSRHGAWKSSTHTRIVKSSLIPGRKAAVSGQSFTGSKLATKKVPSKKVPVSNTQYRDTSVERLLREVTNEKFWHHPEDEELQCVPGCFESVEEYIRVFEPLLFEECRAQLYSTWEESLEAAGSHVRVLVKSIERRERGWFDVILHPLHEHKWAFKEGDVAVLSTPKPASVNYKRNITSVLEDETVTGRVCGTVRRHMPIDTREHTGAILHFYIGDLFDSTGKNDDHILGKLQPGGVWYLTVLGSLATIQREYVALHAFRRLNLQMQNAILQPSPDQFPKYEEQPPAMPECFTPNFVDYLRKNFNGPQLAAIQWAAMHTAAGTSNAMAKRQDPWPFTLVQGPPGTGKTHTVWGMLNVIHLVQYQHYYAALLKKLSPESHKQVQENSSNSVAVGSIDEVLQSMDQNLFRILPKLCPKPRMLVCAPSNAATDELLSRVLDRGFIDGEMKIYRPDVARVGVDSQTRAAQAVSVECRTEQLLLKSRDEVCGWMLNLRVRETQLVQQITCFQRELNAAAAAGRSQGSVGVDPDVLVARDQNRDSLLQNLAAVVENRDKILVEMSRLVILE